MRAAVKPFRARGVIAAPAGKSIVHRALVLAAQGTGKTFIPLDGLNEDIRATCRCLKALGAGIDERPGGLTVCRGDLGVPEAPRLDCGESGTTLRFMLPMAASLKGARFSGSGRLPSRPMEDLCAAVAAHGAKCTGERVPFAVTGGMRGGVFSLPGNITSQYVSGLLLSAPLRREDTIVRLTTALESVPYVEMTVRCLRNFGVTVERTCGAFLVPGGQRPLR